MSFDSSNRRVLVAARVLVACGLLTSFAEAHHEALFGPQSSLAVESEAFVSLQDHVHVTGTGSSLDQEFTYILSAGVTPFRSVPWSVALVQPYTVEVARTPTGNQTGAFSSCARCLTRENLLVSTSYRFDFTGLRRVTGKDGNFALTSVSLEPPTGAKEYPALQGPFNGILAELAGVEWGSWSVVGIGYYRINATDDQGSKKGNNWLAGAGAAYTPIDERTRMLSVQFALAAEVHDRDVLGGNDIEASGGWEIFGSPTVVWSPGAHTRFFAYVSLPVVQHYRSTSEQDRFRSGLGIIWSFERSDAAH